MIVRTFDAAEHEEFGTLGWRMKGMPNADPLDGMAIAHDILEHMPSDNGSCEHELMALGASLHVRGLYWHEAQGNLNPTPVHLASDINMQIGYLLQRGDSLTLRDPGRTLAIEDEDIERAINETVRQAVKLVREEGHDRKHVAEFISQANRIKMRGWLRKGYRRARRRYPKQYKATQVFDAIIKELARYKPEFEGQQITVSVDVSREIVRVREVEDEY